VHWNSSLSRTACASVRSQIAPQVHLISVAINRICALGGSDRAIDAGEHIVGRQAPPSYIMIRLSLVNRRAPYGRIVSG